MYGSKMKSEETDHLFEAILSLKDLEECYRFFDDLCTFSEIQAMTQRLQVAEMLEAGNTFSQISKEIGVSIHTASAPAVWQGLSSFLPLSLISRAVKRLSVVKSYRKKQK